METEVVRTIEEKINNKMLIVLDCHDKELLSIFHEAISKKHIFNVEIWHCMKAASKYDYVKCISRKEMNEVLEIYRMYDFSDKVIIISDSNQYGSLFNYVKTGILTNDEMVEALLYKIRGNPEMQ